MGHSWIQTLRSLIQWKWQVTSALRMPSSPSCLGDSLIFCDNKLAKLAGQGYHIPTYWEKATVSTGSSKTHQSLRSKENSQKPPHRDKESSKPGSKTLGTSSPWIPDSTSTIKASCKSKLSPPLKNKGISATRRSVHLSQKSRKTNVTLRTAMSPPSPRSHPQARKTASGALTRAAITLPVKGTASATFLHILPH